jgi:hypothetical protein
MSTQSEAQALADRLAAYWRANGFPAIKTWVEAQHANDNDTGTLIYSVRSNLVNATTA